MLAAIAIIFGYIESLFPIPLPIPGIKLGLGNIVILICLYNFNKKTAFIVMLIKVLTSVLLFSAPSALIYSLAGGTLSLLIMSFMRKYNFHIITVSIGGGISHNLGQLLAAALVLKNINVLYYLPLLIISGAVIALATGICAKIIDKRISKIIK